MGSRGYFSLPSVGEISLSETPRAAYAERTRFFAFRRGRGSRHDSDPILSAFFPPPPPQAKNLDFRRKWDKDEYEKLAEKRLTEEREKKDGGCRGAAVGWRAGEELRGLRSHPSRPWPSGPASACLTCKRGGGPKGLYIASQLRSRLPCPGLD